MERPYKYQAQSRAFMCFFALFPPFVLYNLGIDKAEKAYGFVLLISYSIVLILLTFKKLELTIDETAIKFDECDLIPFEQITSYCYERVFLRKESDEMGERDVFEHYLIINVYYDSTHEMEYTYEMDMSPERLNELAERYFKNVKRLPDRVVGVPNLQK